MRYIYVVSLSCFIIILHVFIMPILENLVVIMKCEIFLIVVVISFCGTIVVCVDKKSDLHWIHMELHDFCRVI